MDVGIDVAPVGASSRFAQILCDAQNVGKRAPGQTTRGSEPGYEATQNAQSESAGARPSRVQASIRLRGLRLSRVTLGTSIAFVRTVNDDCPYRMIEAERGLKPLGQIGFTAPSPLGVVRRAEDAAHQLVQVGVNLLRRIR